MSILEFFEYIANTISGFISSTSIGNYPLFTLFGSSAVIFGLIELLKNKSR